jgi:hypothetical protein
MLVQVVASSIQVKLGITKDIVQLVEALSTFKMLGNQRIFSSLEHGVGLS